MLAEPFHPFELVALVFHQKLLESRQLVRAEATIDLEKDSRPSWRAERREAQIRLLRSDWLDFLQYLLLGLVPPRRQRLLLLSRRLGWSLTRVALGRVELYLLELGLARPWPSAR